VSRFWDAFRELQILHWAFLIIAAIGFFAFWAHTRFWLPKYVHLLAAVGLVIGLWGAYGAPDDAPVNKQGLVVKALFALALPAMVYFFFVFYGGQRAAFERRFGASAPCPYCKHPVAALRGGNSAVDGECSYVDQNCPHCGQTLGG
jgi:hypothetical protein